jgi:uncharacterized membrane-anchored protein YitT (DUF2179 family)
MKFDLKRFVIINIGLLILAFGLYFFLNPSNLAVGGASGLALVISNLLPMISFSLLLGIINVTLFIIAFIVLGKEFGGYTLYASLALSGILSLLEHLFPMTEPFTDDLFINLIFGILITGVGMGLVFNENASTGGTDIIAKIIHKYAHIEIGKSLLIADFIITLFAGFVFGPRLGMYALLGVIINSFVIDKMIAGFNIKINMIIITNEYEKVNDYIIHTIVRGTTIYHGTGGYSKEDKRIINTIVDRSEYIKIRDFTKSVDHRAFIAVSHITEVEGEGFTFD